MCDTMNFTSCAAGKSFRMLVVVTMLVTALSVTLGSPKSRVKYDISWDPAVTEQLRWGHVFNVDVNINEYMDIICPQYDVDAPANQVMKFVIYNVSKQTFADCSRGNDARKILACDTPSKNKKLTLKFQQFSPNPFGFVYHPGKSYYFMAYGEHVSESGADACKGCMRMQVNVRPNRNHHHPKPTKHDDLAPASSAPPTPPPPDPTTTTTTKPPPTVRRTTPTTTKPTTKKKRPTPIAEAKQEAFKGSGGNGSSPRGGALSSTTQLAALLLLLAVGRLVAT